MSYTESFTIHLGVAYTGKTIHAQLYDTAGTNSGAAITTGITELTGGQGIYICALTIADSFQGGVKFYESGTSVILAAGCINPDLNELWRVVYKKVTETATELKFYDNAGTAVLKTCTLSDDGVTKTKGAAA